MLTPHPGKAPFSRLLVVGLENSHRHTNGTKIIARKIGSFLGAEANKSKDEHDDEDDSLISGSGLKATLVQSRSEGLTLPRRMPYTDNLHPSFLELQKGFPRNP